MAPELKKVIAELTQKYGKIKPPALTPTWNNSVKKSIHNDDLLLWFDTTDGKKHLVRLDKCWKIKYQ